MTTLVYRLCIFACALQIGGVHAATVVPSWEHPPHQQRGGVFWRSHWYDREAFAPRLGYTRRARINAPKAVLDPRWGVRTETKENGLLLIPTPESLFQIRAAELYAELWGGHPGTGNSESPSMDDTLMRFPGPAPKPRIAPTVTLASRSR